MKDINFAEFRSFFKLKRKAHGLNVGVNLVVTEQTDFDLAINTSNVSSYLYGTEVGTQWWSVKSGRHNYLQAGAGFIILEYNNNKYTSIHIILEYYFERSFIPSIYRTAAVRCIPGTSPVLLSKELVYGDWLWPFSPALTIRHTGKSFVENNRIYLFVVRINIWREQI